MFTQIVDPLHNLTLTALVALIPLVLLLALLAGFRMSAWLATIIASIVTFALAVWVWQMPVQDGLLAYLYGAATGIWNVDWITLWGVMIFNTLQVTGDFERFRRWIMAHATADVRVQAILLAWAFGALLEGLVGFGYPWAVVAPILVASGIPDLDALRVAAIANNAPVSYGALGVPIIALATVTGLPLMALSASVGRIVAVLALLPPWILIYLVTGKKGLRNGWPLAAVGSLAYIAGQFPVSQFLGPYLPDIVGAIVSFAAVFILLRFWRPSPMLAYGGEVITESGQKNDPSQEHGLSAGEVIRAWFPFLVLIAVVVLWTGPWSPLTRQNIFSAKVQAMSPVTHKPVAAAFIFNPFVSGTAIFTSWLLIVLFVRPGLGGLKEVVRRTFHQMWGALLVGAFIFGLAFTFNFSGMATSLASAFSHLGTAYLLVAPLLGWIGVALSGSNTSTNAMFGYFQVQVGNLLKFPNLLLPSLNSVGAEIGKPIAPQTASVGVSTSKFVRNEGEVIRHNMGWTLVLLFYLMLIALLFYFVLPNTMTI